MYLAWKEIRHSKLKYSLIGGIILLISYLVFFLIFLAFGLSNAMKSGYENIKADGVYIKKSANKNIISSRLTDKDYDAININENLKDKLKVQYSVVNKKDNDININVTFFSYDKSSTKGFLDLIEGRQIKSEDEVIASETLKNINGLHINDQIENLANKKNLTIVGFTKKSTLATQPIIYQWLKKGEMFNAVVIYQEILSKQQREELEDNNSLEFINKNDLINNVAGYKPQILTFSLMIGFLVLISSIIIAVFIYILTMQKQKIFGILKAQGIRGGYIARSVIAQTFIIMVFGILVGLLLSVVTIFALPAKVPVEFTWFFTLVISIIMLIASLLGAIFSVIAINKIDPIKSIS